MKSIPSTETRQSSPESSVYLFSKVICREGDLSENWRNNGYEHNNKAHNLLFLNACLQFLQLQSATIWEKFSHPLLSFQNEWPQMHRLSTREDLIINDMESSSSYQLVNDVATAKLCYRQSLRHQKLIEIVYQQWHQNLSLFANKLVLAPQK